MSGEHEDFADPSEILNNADVSISQLFALLRQWHPATQERIDDIVHRILDLGESVPSMLVNCMISKCFLSSTVAQAVVSTTAMVSRT